MTRVMAIAAIVSVLIVTFCYLALSNQPLPLWGDVLPRHAAQVVYWFMTVATLACLIPVGALAKRSSGKPQMIELNASAAIVPKASVGYELLTIPYAEIRKIDLHAIHGQKVLVIRSSVGGSSLVSTGFSDREAFEGFVKTLRLHYARAKRLVSASPAGSREPAISSPKAGTGLDSKVRSTRIVTFDELAYEPAPPRYGKRMGAALDEKERAVDMLLDSCFLSIGCKQYNRGAVYIVSAEQYSRDEERMQNVGTEIVLTKSGIEVHSHNVDRKNDHQVSRFDDLESFLRSYVGEGIRAETTREVVRAIGADAWTQARVSGNWQELFQRTAQERHRIEDPMKDRLEAFLLGDEVASVARLLDK